MLELGKIAGYDLFEILTLKLSSGVTFNRNLVAKRGASTEQPVDCIFVGVICTRVSYHASSYLPVPILKHTARKQGVCASEQ